MSLTGNRQFTSIYLSCRSALARAVSKIVGRNEVEDILQETFVRSYEADHQGEIRHARAFLLRTATNLALNHVSRSEYRTTGKLDDLPLDETPACNNPSPDKQLESNQQWLLFCRAVDNLPLQCRRVFVMRKVYGMSQQEIAKKLRVSESTVEKHVAKGLLLCREQLANVAQGRDAKREASA
jgi:RNA polymerase sigma factor (sigma-70 family)